MKKITMFVEELSDDYDLIGFYPNNATQNRLKEQLNDQRSIGFEDGVKDVIGFIDKNPPPEAGAKLCIVNPREQYDTEYEAPKAVEMPVIQPPQNELIPQGDGTVGIPVRSSIEASDITVTPDGCIINKRFLPADILLAAASAVHKYQMENE